MRRRTGPGRAGGLRRRLVWTTALVSAAAMAATVGAVALVIANLSANRVDDELRSRIDTAAAALLLGPDGAPSLASNQADDADDAVWLYDSAGRLISGPQAGEELANATAALAHVTSSTATTRGERRFVAEPVAVPGHPGVEGVMVASESLEPFEQTRDIALYSLLAVGLAVIAGTAGLTWWTVGRTLRPVHQMTEQAAEWSDKDLDTRFDLGVGTDEFTELGNTLDALLDRVATALRAEQRLTSELAHELRSPLTAIRGEAELGSLAAPGDPRYSRIIDLVDRLSSTITTLLAVARDQPGTHRRADVYAVISDLLLAHPDPAVEVEFDAVPDRFIAAVSPELVERAVAPVLDNAFRYASSSVGITVAASGARLHVRVSDDGPGVDAEVRRELFDAGGRSSSSGGAGLGLALARRVAAAAGGDVTVVSAAEPTTFEINLPRR